MWTQLNTHWQNSLLLRAVAYRNQRLSGRRVAVLLTIVAVTASLE